MIILAIMMSHAAILQMKIFCPVCSCLFFIIVSRPKAFIAIIQGVINDVTTNVIICTIVYPGKGKFTRMIKFVQLIIDAISQATQRVLVVWKSCFFTY